MTDVSQETLDRIAVMVAKHLPGLRLMRLLVLGSEKGQALARASSYITVVPSGDFFQQQVVNENMPYFKREMAYQSIPDDAFWSLLPHPEWDGCTLLNAYKVDPLTAAELAWEVRTRGPADGGTP